MKKKVVQRRRICVSVKLCIGDATAGLLQSTWAQAGSMVSRMEKQRDSSLKHSNSRHNSSRNPERDT